jgi:hypothetical protein
MSKKTRQQKIIAEYRRKMKMMQNTSITPPITVTPKIKPVEIHHGKEEDTVIRDYFLSDVRKSLILIAFIIALEIGLYFVNISGNLERIIKF